MFGFVVAKFVTIIIQTKIHKNMDMRIINVVNIIHKKLDSSWLARCVRFLQSVYLFAKYLLKEINVFHWHAFEAIFVSLRSEKG